MSSELGVGEEKILSLDDYASSGYFNAQERTALAYADAMTLSDQDVGDDLFVRLEEHFSVEAIVELTAVIAWENASSKFNRALRVPSQQLWRRD